MQKKGFKLTAVYALIMDLPLAILVTLVSLLLSHNFNMQSFVMMSILAYVVTFFVNFLPNDRVAFKFAVKHAEPGTLKFGLIMNGIISLIFTLIMNVVMTGVAVLLIAHQPFPAFVMAFLMGFIPAYVVAFIVAFIMNPIADKASRKICKEPAPHNA